MLVIKQKIVLILLLLPLIIHADDLKNPYMMPIKINMQECIHENMTDCLQSICMASPASCRSQCTTNATDKCKMLAGQNVYGD